MKTTWLTIKNILAKDGVVILPTDTLYGIVGRAFSKKAVERVYKVKGRDKGKPCIVLISSFEDLKKFNINIDKLNHGLWAPFIHHIWPDKVSVVLPCPSSNFKYLHRGTKAIAFRMVSPKHKNLYKLINDIGPLVAPSANPQGLLPACTIVEASGYFGGSVDSYIGGKVKDTSASTLVSLLGTKPKILRQGSVDIYK